MDIYRAGIRPVLFSGLKVDPEWLHQRSLQLFSGLISRQQSDQINWMLDQLEHSCSIKDRRLQQKLWNVEFPNPVGLAAGFDKNGIAALMWQRLGFGFAELGTVTCHPQPGNPLPRLFRLPQDRAVLNRMGFNNRGSQAMNELLSPLVTKRQIPWGINLGKSKVTPLAEAATDYLTSFQRLQDLGDYFVVNVSSPNTPGLRSLQDKDQLGTILAALKEANYAAKPILVKIAPDLEWDAIADVLDLATTYNLGGIIATNTTISRDGLQTRTIQATGKSPTQEAGGISGAPLRNRATEVIRFIWRESDGKVPIIGVGGISTPEDAWEKIIAGASLIQVYTGWVYEGPWMVRRILEGLQQRLEQRGLKSISEAVGIGSE